MLLCASVFGGGALLWVGGRFVARIPGVTYWRSVGANLLAEFLAAIVSALVALAFHLVFGSPEAGWGPAAVVGLAITWLVISRIFETSLYKAFLAWLPTLGEAVIALPIVMLVILPAIGEIEQRAEIALTRSKINIVQTAWHMYRDDTGGRPADDRGLEALIEPPKHYNKWQGRNWGGPYLPSQSKDWLLDAWGNELRYELRKEKIEGRIVEF
ncbi:MAG: type II secretion system protein GspG, partial [Planctomycetes bacterium]|nr:type II secretion system protein GspG [Planctomycetota bacterium]